MAKKKVYWINWFNKDGIYYHSTSNVDWDGVRKMKRLAKMLGETIEYFEMSN